jgi:myosin heavy subunit
MLDSTSIGQINRALESSFSNIKKDMNELKLAISSQNEQFATLRKEIESVKADAVSKDKLNVLKIKIGELNESLKKLWDIEKQLKSFDPSEAKKAVSQELESLNAKLIAANMKINDVSKHAASETQLKAVVSEINHELNNLAAEVRRVEFKKEELQKDLVEKQTEKIEHRIASLHQEIANVRSETKRFVDHNEVKHMLENINSEFERLTRDLHTVSKSYVKGNEIKNMLIEVNNDFDKVRKELDVVKTESKIFVKDAEIKDVLKNINKEFDGIASELSNLKSNVSKQDKKFVTTSQVKGLIDDISNEFVEVKERLGKLDELKKLSEKIRDVENKSVSVQHIEELRKEFSDLQKDVKKTTGKFVTKPEFENELKEIDAELEVLNKNEQKAASAASLKAYEPAKRLQKIIRYRRTRFIGSFLIFVAFLFLIASIASYYAGQQLSMDNFAIAAVITFLVGILVRIIVAIKSK